MMVDEIQLRRAIEKHEEKHHTAASAGYVSGGVSAGYCEWRYWQPCEMNTWDTSCGEAHCMIEGGIQENKYRFCPYCGKPIKEL